MNKAIIIWSLLLIISLLLGFVSGIAVSATYGYTMLTGSISALSIENSQFTLNINETAIMDAQERMLERQLEYMKDELK